HKIPAGKTQTYAWLARRSGYPNAARAVGNVMAGNPVPFLLPCHRIVPASGGIGNYGLGKELKRKLLRREGVDLI
ncbi:MAG: MGMT family protein, partial [Acidobacteriota bacterium]